MIAPMKVALVALVAVLSAVGCTGGTDTATPPPVSPSPVEIRVATLNIEYGGEVTDFDATVEAALALDADVIGIEEAWGNIPRLAEEMGYPYYDPEHQVVSRLPPLRPPGDDGTYLLVEVGEGVAALANAHLSSSPYGPNMARNGKGADEIAATEERVRVPEIEPAAAALSALAEAGTPAFLVGDMNSPSHLDWTEEAVGTRPHVTEPVAWPVTVLLEDEGFLDSYREVHPDPVADPGLTWPAARPEAVPGWDPGPNAAADRIDYVFHAGPSEVVASQIAGEEGAGDLSVAPWPTDHRGVVSTFTVTPGPAPVVVSPDQRRVEAGDEVGVRFHAPGPVTLEVRSADGVAVASAPTDGDPTIDTTDVKPGAYEIVMAAEGTTLASAPLWVLEPGAGAELAIADDTVREGEPIEVSWTAAPGNRWDWIGVYRRGADPEVDWYLVWAYTDATIEGTLAVDEDAEGRWPLKAGEYTVYLLEDDAYEVLAGADFEIVAS